jgi:regulator of replication initiation timing
MSEPTTHGLIERISRLEQAIEALTQRLEEEIKPNDNMDRLNSELRRLVENDMFDAFQRIKSLELKLFPGLGGDIVHLNGIIGEGDGKAWNLLDKRTP